MPFKQDECYILGSFSQETFTVGRFHQQLRLNISHSTVVKYIHPLSQHLKVSAQCCSCPGETETQHMS